MAACLLCCLTTPVLSNEVELVISWFSLFACQQEGEGSAGHAYQGAVLY